MPARDYAISWPTRNTKKSKVFREHSGLALQEIAIDAENSYPLLALLFESGTQARSARSCNRCGKCLSIAGVGWLDFGNVAEAPQCIHVMKSPCTRIKRCVDGSRGTSY
jgi:hypothetical protein